MTTEAEAAVKAERKRCIEICAELLNICWQMRKPGDTTGAYYTASHALGHAKSRIANGYEPSS